MVPYVHFISFVILMYILAILESRNVARGLFHKSKFFVQDSLSILARLERRKKFGINFKLIRHPDSSKIRDRYYHYNVCRFSWLDTDKQRSVGHCCISITFFTQLVATHSISYYKIISFFYLPFGKLKIWVCDP